MQNFDTTKYVIHAQLNTEGVVERPDVVGAIFGQTEGLIGDELDLRDLQKTGRIGRIEVRIETKGGKAKGSILIPSSLDKIETAILAAALETIERVGPCMATIQIQRIEDVRTSKRRMVIDRAKTIHSKMFDEAMPESQEITEEVKNALRVEEISTYGRENLPSGPNIENSDAILIVEGRADVLNLLKYGIKNAVAVEGTNIPQSIVSLCKQKTVTAYVDGDRGGELILKELLQIADIDYVARAANGKGVEELTQKEILKSLRNKVPVEQAVDPRKIKRGKPQKEIPQKEIPQKEIPQKEMPVRRRNILPLRKERVVETIIDKTPEVVEDKGRALATKEIPETSSPHAFFKDQLTSLSGTLNAVLLDENNGNIKEVAVRDLANVLKESNNKVKNIIFDGIITQRILDIAAEKELTYVVGIKLGNIIKFPVSIKVLTLDQLK